MSAETNSVVPAARRPGPALAPVLAVLADGTPAFAPIGGVVVDDGRVVCHLCGRALRSVTAHLRVHGYTKAGRPGSPWSPARCGRCAPRR
jgi:hypothetical protein